MLEAKLVDRILRAMRKNVIAIWRCAAACGRSVEMKRRLISRALEAFSSPTKASVPRQPHQTPHSEVRPELLIGVLGCPAAERSSREAGVCVPAGLHREGRALTKEVDDR